MPKSYQPGARNRQYGQDPKLSENRYAWVHTESGKYLILVGEDIGHGPDVVIYLPRPGRVPDVSINLTGLTEPELQALKELFSTAFEWAQPVVERRDKEAADAWESGDDSHTRNYRRLPTVVYRKRPGDEHRKGVQQRPAGVPEGGGGERAGDSGGVRGTGDELAQPDAEYREPEDNSTPSD